MSVDPAFGTNNFGAPKMYSESETLANNIVATLLGRPGSYPSMPDLFMGIQDYLMSMEDDIDEEAIKNELVSQCSHFKQVVRDGNFQVTKTNTTMNGKDIPLILFAIPTIVENRNRNLAIGFTKDGNNLKFNFAQVD